MLSTPPATRASTARCTLPWSSGSSTLPRRGDPLRDGRHPFSRDEGVGLLDVEVVLVVAPLTGDFEDVAESRGDDGSDGGAPGARSGRWSPAWSRG